ncbi:hypothetical protein K438DRAFT_904410 [Mycena galopus ATCC 62051]|nr:hypothetical protein K438DRAFT_904410 [Mycena galopus ATCC 62051]
MMTYRTADFSLEVCLAIPFFIPPFSLTYTFYVSHPCRAAAALSPCDHLVYVRPLFILSLPSFSSFVCLVRSFRRVRASNEPVLTDEQVGPFFVFASVAPSAGYPCFPFSPRYSLHVSDLLHTECLTNFVCVVFLQNSLAV